MEELLKSMEWDELFIRQMYLIASKSKDPRTHIGAVLVKDNTILSMGYNGFPRGVLDTKNRYLDRELKYKLVAHAEVNAVVNAARFGLITLDSILYTNGVPCNECAKVVINAGVKSIVVHKQFPNHGVKWNEAAQISQTMFKEAGIPIYEFDQKLDIKTLVDGQLAEV